MSDRMWAKTESCLTYELAASELGDFSPYFMDESIGPAIDVAVYGLHQLTETRAELAELRRRHQALLDALDTDRSTSISKRAVRAILKGR